MKEGRMGSEKDILRRLEELEESEKVTRCRLESLNFRLARLEELVHLRLEADTPEEIG